jgi:hypothetical protein
MSSLIGCSLKSAKTLPVICCIVLSVKIIRDSLNGIKPVTDPPTLKLPPPLPDVKSLSNSGPVKVTISALP